MLGSGKERKIWTGRECKIKDVAGVACLHFVQRNVLDKVVVSCLCLLERWVETREKAGMRRERWRSRRGHCDGDRGSFICLWEVKLFPSILSQHLLGVFHPYILISSLSFFLEMSGLLDAAADILVFCTVKPKLY